MRYALRPGESGEVVDEDRVKFAALRGFHDGRELRTCLQFIDERRLARNLERTDDIPAISFGHLAKHAQLVATWAAC